MKTVGYIDPVKALNDHRSDPHADRGKELTVERHLSKVERHLSKYDQ